MTRFQQLCPLLLCARTLWVMIGGTVPRVLSHNEVFVNPQLWLVVRYHSQEHSTFRKKDDEERSVKAICAVVRFLFPVIMYGRYGTVVW